MITYLKLKTSLFFSIAFQLKDIWLKTFHFISILQFTIPIYLQFTLVWRARSAVVHLNFRAGSTFPVPVCTVPSSMDRTSRSNKVDAVRLYASYMLNLLLLKAQRFEDCYCWLHYSIYPLYNSKVASWYSLLDIIL